MRISSYSVRHKSVVFFFILCLSISGFMAYERLGKLEDPDFTIKTAIVVTPYPGASPHEVELQVTDLIEQAAQSTEHVVEIRSESRAGLSLVYVDVDESMRSHAISHTWESLRKKITAMQAELPPAFCLPPYRMTTATSMGFLWPFPERGTVKKNSPTMRIISGGNC
ncbi:efflux RND transporter permease subunit [Desulfobotulus sp.]|jgi:multidrug efflux pump subunit AcrB|uniref:efflux RND transporter permease subunit n=1 Tax=Desulfobotulus sp. TaxID=1940337 RepID=UPI002A3722EB|nr:efflux RND transporter permease subunit [Desulfobotulus sp.]MDY0164719.1 efflux RND transporter permease subunit [Desulfobotulus sp.]